VRAAEPGQEEPVGRFAEAGPFEVQQRRHALIAREPVAPVTVRVDRDDCPCVQRRALRYRRQAVEQRASGCDGRWLALNVGWPGGPAGCDGPSCRPDLVSTRWFFRASPEGWETITAARTARMRAGAQGRATVPRPALCRPPRIGMSTAAAHRARTTPASAVSRPTPGSSPNQVSDPAPCPSHNYPFCVVFAIMPDEPRAAPIGGYLKSVWRKPRWEGGFASFTGRRRRLCGRRKTKERHREGGRRRSGELTPHRIRRGHRLR
jgi:hypothetical protein